MLCNFCNEEVKETTTVGGVEVCNDCLPNVWECDECGAAYHEDDGVTDFSGSHYCNECYEDMNTCDNCGNIHSSDDSHYFESDDLLLCGECFEALTFRCNECEEFHLSNNQIDTVNGPVCQDCYEDSYVTCSECGDVIRSDDANYNDSDDSYYCNDCYNDLAYIQSYGYKPVPCFHGNVDDGDIFMGVELEVSGGGQSDSNARKVGNILNSTNNVAYFKHDGSIEEGGFEIVTHPCTLEYHLNEVAYESAFKELIRMGYRGHKYGDCGLHVHVGRRELGDADMVAMKLIYIVEKHWDKMVKFSRRTEYQLERWADRYIDSGFDQDDSFEEFTDKVNEKRGARYLAINLCNSSTIEFRFFRSTLKLNTFRATLQFVNVLVQLAKKLDVAQIQAITWNDIVAASSEYGELMHYYAERELYVARPSEEEGEQ